MSNENKNCHITSIGGQAVLEGVMMRGPKEIAVAVRKSTGEIVVDKKPVGSVSQKYPFLKTPVIRGIVAFVESMILGVKTLMFSAELYDIEGEDDPEYKPSKLDLFVEKLFGNKDAVIYFSVALSLVLGILLFVVFPATMVGMLRKAVTHNILRSLIEGVLRMSIFVLYIYLVSLNKDIQRVFMYHGAEHKTIFCYENGEDLTVENVKKYSRLHPRCGTSFLIGVMIISVLVFSLVPWNNIGQRVIIKLILMPFIAGLSYEFIKIAGRSKSALVGMLNQPGMWLQKITTREPDASQIEVAIAALNGVITGNKEDDKW